MTLILGIETSCDETAAAIVADGHWVLSHIVATQHELHERFAGVVPEIASRAHLEQLDPVVRRTLADANIPIDRIDAIAVGNRPGLIGSLLVGVSSAQTLAWATGKPLIGINHVHAHLYAPLLIGEKTSLTPHATPCTPRTPHSSTLYPALGLVVSGGHTSLYQVHGPTDLRILGKTLDDAVGEAYDKAAAILQLGYPGGPKVDQLARSGDAQLHQLPRSLLGRDSLDFSFSGLKTALLYKVRGQPHGRGPGACFERNSNDLTSRQRADLAASFQVAAIETLIVKLQRAMDQLTDGGAAPRRLIIGGGVAANSLLRQRAHELSQRRQIPIDIPALPYCVDNAAMIAGLAHEFLASGSVDGLDLPAIATTTE